VTLHRANFAVLSAPIAACDRRALSQAWYSALHMHRDARSALAGGPSQVLEQRTTRPARPLRLPAAQGVALPRARAVKTATVRAVTLPCPDRRMARTKLARAIETVFLASPAAPRQAAFSVGTGKGRVQILLRKMAGSTQIVALCSEAARETVARALAQVRYTLALRGIAVDADVRGVAS